MVYTPCLELWSGTTVFARDGLVGTVRHVFMHKRKRYIVALVVQHHAPLSHPVIVPVTRITSASHQAIHLDISCSEVDVLPRYSARIYRASAGRQHAGLGSSSYRAIGHGPASEQSRIMAAHMNTHQYARHADIFMNYAPIHARQKVFCQNGCAGRVVAFRASSDGQVRSLIIRRARPWPHLVCMPAEQLDRVDQDGLYLNVRQCKLDVLPPYRPDSALHVVVIYALDHADWQGELDYRSIDVAVHEGVVYLSGYVTEPEQRQHIEQVVRSVQGLSGVVNDLIVDGEVVHAVARSLAAHAWIAAECISVYAHQGVVYLDGCVADMAIRAAAEQCAAQVAQVRGVINHIRVPDSELTWHEDERVLQPQIGQEVFATDRLVGHVERVIINRHNRRVTACVVYECHGLAAANTPRQIVVPISAIHDVTPAGVLLHVDSQVVQDLPRFEKADYMLPPTDWQPPYPYQPAAVLCEYMHAYYSTGSIYQGKPAIVSPPRTRRRGISYKLPI